MRASGVGPRVLPQGSGYVFMGKPSALLGTGSPKPVAEPAKAPEPVREVVARPAPAASAAATPAVAAAAPSADLTKKSESLLKEYFSVMDLKEALLCVQELKSPSFHPEFVRLALATALDMRDRECDLVLKLLVHLHSTEAISSSDLRGGVLLVTEGMEDMSMDAPLAPKLFGGMLAGLVLSGSVELRLVQEASLKLEDEFLQQDVLKAVVGKWKSKESEVELGEVCRKASVDKEGLLSVAGVSDLAKVLG
jgi:translation initiation factor 4G